MRQQQTGNHGSKRKKTSITLVAFFIFNMLILQTQAQEPDSLVSPSYTVDGTLKNKFEYAPINNISRFSVRNSRIGLAGTINSFSSYRIQIELSNEGKFSVLDLSGTLTPVEGLSFTLGQTSIPLFNSYIVSPGPMMFANRAFIGKYFLSTRDIGLLTSYKFNIGTLPSKIEFGVFNGNAINDPVWTRNLSYGGRIELGTMKGLRMTAKIYEYPKDETTHFFFYGTDLRYEMGNWKVETEIMHRESKTEFNPDLFSYYLQSAYRIPFRTKIFDFIKPAVRWDAIGESLDSSGINVNRLTTGIGFGFTNRRFNSILRLDYEWYMVNEPMDIFDPADEMDSDKITLEWVITF